METTFAPAPIYTADCFTSIIEELCSLLTKHSRARFISAPMLLLIWNRLMRMAKRFARIAERVNAGTLSRTPPARSGEASPRPARVRPPRVPAGEKPPDHFRWLVNMIPETERTAGDLCWLLQRPETAELMFNAPQVRRILRPLCRMLGVELTAELRRPLRPPLPRPPETPDQTSEQAPEQTSPPAQHVDDNYSPPSNEPELPVKSDAEIWAEYMKLHPPPAPPKLE